MKNKNILWLVGLFTLLLSRPLFAAVVINEFLADPATGSAGDANGDGTRSSSDDEFVELFNTGPAGINLSLWTLSDASGTRHMFADGTFIDSMERIVVFGGGNLSNLTVTALVASEGSLSLNNASDSIILHDELNNIKDLVSYGSEAAQDQSLVRSPEGSGSFILHSLFSLEKDWFSPGLETNPAPGETRPEPVTVPECNPALLLLFAFALKNSGKKLWSRDFILQP